MFHSYVWRYKYKIIRAGEFHHGNATNRIGSTVFSLSGTFLLLASSLSSTWYTGMSGTISEECGRKQPSWEAHHILLPLFKFCIIIIIPRYMSRGFSNILSSKGDRIAKLIAENGSQRSSSWIFSLSHWGLNSRDVVYAPGDYSFHEKECKQPR